MSTASDRVSVHLDLLDWKRRIFGLYGEVRAAKDPARAWERWREERDELIRTHPQSPVDGSRGGEYEGDYFAYDPASRALADVVLVEEKAAAVPMSRDDGTRFRHVGNAVFELYGQPQSLGLYWLDAYGGGLFLPLTDETSGDTTYGAGRYLLDTVKGADLGTVDGRLVLDFNFAFNPSCAYDVRWSCPLAPPANRLPVAVEAGERLPLATA